MLQSFLTITLRILWRNKVTTFVNIFSLSVGITTFIFIMLYVHHETSYDKFNKNYNRIYRLEGDDWGKLPPVISTYVKERVPEVENVAGLSGAAKANNFLSYAPENNPEGMKHIEVNYFYADSTIFDVFTLPFIQGDPKTALAQPMTAVLTEQTARKLFDIDDPMMKSIEFRDHRYMVTGIIKDVKNSHAEIDVLFSLESYPRLFPGKDINITGPSSWLWNATYLLMREKVDVKQVEDKINSALAEINNGRLFDTEFKNFHIRPMKDLYFDGVVRRQPYGLHGNLKMVRTLIAVGIFMLFLACINYVNLTTARSVIRAKEVAVKRVAGSSANLLRYQLILESIIITLISLVVAVTIMQLFLTKFNEVTLVDIRIDELNRLVVWAGILSAGIGIGILAGIYPAYYLTAIQPVKLIKGEGIKGSGGSIFRNVLMTFQFALSIVMIIGIMVNFQQLHYVRNADLGFNKEQVITINTPADMPNEFTLRETFKKRLIQHSGIEKVAYSYGQIGEQIADASPLEIDGVKRSIKMIGIDADYLDLLGISLSQGRGFSEIMDNNARNDPQGRLIVDVMVNETLVREFGFDNPIGQRLYSSRSSSNYSAEIIGVVKDFHIFSLHDKITPLLIHTTPQLQWVAFLKVASTNIPVTLKKIENEWKAVYGQSPFNYKFLDETFDRHYKNDEQLATVIGYFAGLAVIIACLGLFALSSFMVSRRTKEIGIRKTLGGSVKTIYIMLSWGFIKWILLAVVIASPIAWYLMDMWLQTFAYRIKPGPGSFILAALLAIIIALITVTWQSLKTALANPVKALRYE